MREGLICIGEQCILNLENVNYIDLGQGGATVNFGDGAPPKHFTGEDAQALANWARTALPRLYPDRIEQSTTVNFRPAQTMRAGSHTG